MFVTATTIDGGVELTDRGSGERLALVKVTSIVQRSAHTEVCLGVEAPQSTKITPFDRSKELAFRNGHPKKHTQ
ncbi:MAG: hypothetical protein ACYS1A_18140 [Planctomycetota bacterium]|jgi:hypothetical protein